MTDEDGSNTGLYQGNVLKFISAGDGVGVAIVDGGTGYTLYDTLTVAAPPGGTSATVQVTGIINPGGIVFGVTFVTYGSGYSAGTYATTGGTGTGCTLAMEVYANSPFGVGRILADGEFLVASKNPVEETETSGVVTYVAGGVQHDRTGNLLTVIGDPGWEGTADGVGNSTDNSAIEVFTYSVEGYE
jgi:hypothetical protein